MQSTLVEVRIRQVGWLRLVECSGDGCDLPPFFERKGKGYCADHFPSAVPAEQAAVRAIERAICRLGEAERVAEKDLLTYGELYARCKAALEDEAVTSALTPRQLARLRAARRFLGENRDVHSVRSPFRSDA